MDDLPLDVIYIIAQQNYKAWIRLLLIEPRFREFVWANQTTIRTLVKVIFKTTIKEQSTTQTFLFDKLHSFDDVPAYISYEGHKSKIQIWCVNGNRHRDNDLPAFIDANDGQSWWVNGKRHRDNDLPAYIGIYGIQSWWYNDKRHRDNDLPAYIGANGTQEWWVNGKRHRTDGPAYDNGHGEQEWWENGKRI